MLDPLMPINPGCNSEPPADQFTSIVDSFWPQEPQNLLVRAKNHKKPTTSFSPIILSVDCQQLVKARQAEKWQDGAWLLQCMGVIGSHASWKPLQCLLTPGVTTDSLAQTENKIYVAQINKQSEFYNGGSAKQGTSLYQSNMTLMCFYSCLTQQMMNLLAGQDVVKWEAGCPWLVGEHMATCRGWCGGVSREERPIGLQASCWELFIHCLCIVSAISDLHPNRLTVYQIN